MATLNVYKDCTNIIQANLNQDVSEDTLISQIRAGKTMADELIAEWTIDYADDGVDGEIILTIDNSDLQNVTQDFGYMDIKRINNGEPMNMFKKPLRVRFRDTVSDEDE